VGKKGETSILYRKERWCRKRRTMKIKSLIGSYNKEPKGFTLYPWRKPIESRKGVKLEGEERKDGIRKDLKTRVWGRRNQVQREREKC